jgi:colicin import membrane protein
MSLLERTRTGLREMPSNAAWLVSRALKPADAIGSAAESAGAGARDRGRKVKAAVVDAAPIGGDSVEVRMRRAQDAGERAREAEDRAVEAARESKDLAAHVRQMSERGRARLKEVEQETSRQVKQRVAQAQKAAEADAEGKRKEVQEEIDDEMGDASQQRAEELVEDATEKLAEARRLADEAAEAARAAAEEANRQAEQIAGEADQHASDAEERVNVAEQLRGHAAATAKRTARELGGDLTNGGLESYKKPELVDLAASIGIKGRTNMTKGELVHAITNASRAKR